jgi:lipopolysaccharide/colanic/teichoic acid biosynthesis glycosyltransferase
MSLIGPRPERPEWEAKLRDEIRFYDRRHLAKPGMTGWAQVRCGYAGSMAGTAYKLCHDLYYLKYRSVPRDLLILSETAVVLMKKILFEEPSVEPSPLSAPADADQGRELSAAEDGAEDRPRVLDADLA